MEDQQLGQIIRDVLFFEAYDVRVFTEQEFQARGLSSADAGAGLLLLDSQLWDSLHLEARQRPAHARVPIILCTPYSFFAPSGASGILRMPFTLEELLRMVAAHLR